MSSKGEQDSFWQFLPRSPSAPPAITPASPTPISSGLSLPYAASDLNSSLNTRVVLRGSSESIATKSRAIVVNVPTR